MLKPEYTTRFKKDIQLMQKRGYKMEKIKIVINKIASEEIPLPIKYRDHDLCGNFEGHRECHIEPDWLMIYYYRQGQIVVFTRTGTHSDLFR
jgi:mRNA interferase YafQ